MSSSEHPSHVLSGLKMHPNGSTIAWSAGNCLFVYDLAEQKWIVERSERHVAPVRSIDYSPMDKVWVTAGDDKHIIVWSEQWEELGSVVFAKKINGIACSADGCVLAGDRFGEITIFRIADIIAFKKEARMVGMFSHLAMVSSISMSRDGKYVLSGDKDEKVRITRYPNTYNVQSFGLGHKEFVSAVVDVNETQVISTSADGTVRLWDTQTGDARHTLTIGGLICNAQRLSNGVLLHREGLKEVSEIRVEGGMLIQGSTTSLPSVPQAILPVEKNGTQGFLWVDLEGRLMPWVPLAGDSEASAPIFSGEPISHVPVFFWKYRKAGAADEDED